MSSTEWIALASIMAGLVSLTWQVRAKRGDDKHAAQLDRLNRQLSELYGPLYALYEEGERNWMLFVACFSHDSRPWAERTFLPSGSAKFPPPSTDCMVEYRRRMEQLFMPTNTKMEESIIQHADLIVGTRMPDEFSDFLAHVAAAKLLMHRWKEDATFGPNLWEQHRVEYPHPPALKHRIRGSFEVLKATQQDLLTGSLESVDEAELERRIKTRMDKLAEQWARSGPSYSDKLSEAKEEMGQVAPRESSE
jgi:hypothetical protein